MNEEKHEEKNEVERVPAPVESEKGGKKKKRVAYILGGVFIGIFSFFAGFGVRWFTLEEDMRTLINVKNKIDKEYYEEIPDDVFYDAIFDAVNNDVLDAYSQYIQPQQYAQNNSVNAGNRSGIGISFLTQTENGEPQLLVVGVAGNSPAEEAGIRVGERITGFGENAENITDSVDFATFKAFLDERADEENFYVRVEGKDGARVVATYKSDYVESYVFYRTKDASYTFTGAKATDLTERGEPLTCLDEDTAYIRLIQFTGRAASLMKKALNFFKEQGKKNLVLDLRGNGGGNLDVMQEIASYFCKNAKGKTPLIAVADYGEKRERFDATGNVYNSYFSEDSRICVLADVGTASASEALMGAMLDYGTIGYDDICLIETNGVARTFGKGIMQTTYIMDVFKQDALKLTTATIRWPVSNTCIHGRGILASDGTKSVQSSYEYETELNSAIQALFS
ncbi:MAG: hypothetical protein IJX30_04800 [Clostridia bacterium]|nr:hypothetical protein [Clostridia bacterium]